MRLLCLVLLVFFTPDRGIAQEPDFQRFVVLGDSFIAGFSDGGLVETVQQRNIPQSFLVLATGDASGFEQPLVSAPGLPPLLELISIDPLEIVPQAGSGTPLNDGLARPFDNLGVPGFAIADIINSSGGNPLADLVLRGLGTPLEQALSLNPTTALLWVGNQDAFPAITSGIVIDGITLTPAADFEADLRTAVEALVNTGSTVLLVPVLDAVRSFPFVNFLPNVVTDGAGNPILDNGQPIPLLGPDGPLASNDAVLLPALGALDQGIGVPVAQGGTGQPLADQMVLNAAEISVIEARIAAYNAAIQRVALEQPDGTTRLLPDPSAILTTLSSGGALGGTTGTFPTGGFFSLDGLHPTARGYEIIAAALFAPFEPVSIPALSPHLLIALVVLMALTLLLRQQKIQHRKH